jgi:hypothetical protein
MPDLPDYDEVYLQVGRTLTEWNIVEHELIDLLEYAHMVDGYIGPEVSVSYWAIVSFEARLGMCNAVVLFRTEGDQYKELRERWTSLWKRIKRNVRKRNTVAHGSLRLMPDKSSGMTACLVPYIGQRMTQFRVLPDEKKRALHIHLKPVRLKELKKWQEEFGALTKDIRTFRISWHEKDIETDRHKSD